MQGCGAITLYSVDVCTGIQQSRDRCSILPFDRLEQSTGSRLTNRRPGANSQTHTNDEGQGRRSLATLEIHASCYRGHRTVDNAAAIGDHQERHVRQRVSG